jgi:hypothetical protein
MFDEETSTAWNSYWFNSLARPVPDASGHWTTKQVRNYAGKQAVSCSASLAYGQPQPNRYRTAAVGYVLANDYLLFLFLLP